MGEGTWKESTRERGRRELLLRIVRGLLQVRSAAAGHQSVAVASVCHTTQHKFVCSEVKNNPRHHPPRLATHNPSMHSTRSKAQHSARAAAPTSRGA